MYISELNLHGFKSFAKKEKLKFGEGVTVIVGPNGCGKTNIVDAIRWVLGEQKYSVLRSGKMGDVIFNGADGLKPLSVCEAFLTVHNNQGKLPLEYNDIEIGRRVYRDGESEYYINRTPCRLKDIHDLFVDTGMGSDAYSVIELKMIEQILSETADDRKRMFEEAAGINKYKQQRRSALRKFDAVQQDLERINDIVQEVEQKVHSLNLQLKRFKRHEKLSDELKEKELSLAFIKIHDYKIEINPLSQRVKDSQHLKDEAKTDTSIHEKELDQLKTLYGEQQSELNALQTSLQSLEEEREQSQNNVLVWSEKDRSADSNIERLEKESISNKDKNVELANQTDQYEKDISALSPQLDKQLKEYKLKKSDFEKVQKRYEDSQSELESIQNNRWDAQQKIANDKSLLDKTHSLIEEKKNVIDRLKIKIHDIESDQSVKEKEQKNLDKKNLELKKVLEKTNSKLSNARISLTKNKEELTEISMEVHTKKSKLEFLEGQLSFYNELVEQKEGYPEGVRNVLNSSENISEAIGTVGDLFQMKDKYRLAFQSALGEWVNCLVAKDRKSALKILSLAKANQFGNLSILPLKEMSHLIEQKKLPPKGKGIIGVADELSGIKADYKKLAQLLVGNLLIVDDLEIAMNSHDLSDWDVVDLNGLYSGKNYLLRHRSGNEDSSVLGRNNKIKLLKKEISSISNAIELSNKKLDSQKKIVEDKSLEVEKYTKALDTAREDLHLVDSELIQVHSKQSQSIDSLGNLRQEIKDTEKELDNLEKSTKELEPSLNKAEELISKLKNKITSASKSLITVQTERDNFQQNIQKLRIDLLSLENERDTLNLKKRVAGDTIQELQKRDNAIAEEISTLNEEKVSLKTNIKIEEKDLNKISSQIVKDRSVMELKRETVNGTYQSMEDVQSKIRSEQQTRESLIEDMKVNELKIIELQQKINIIVERIRDRYDLEIPQNLIVDEDVDDLELRIEKIQRSVESIGPINMAVQDEIDDEQSRLDTFIEQREDLVSSEDNLRETIQKIDKVARKKFQETFDQIKLNFGKLFGLFFEGGTASLELIGDPDPLESDISIMAQPPGKKNQGLRMLSAGEKSLTAIALLFAIYQYKPSPYCILDEVDAPLDDVNIQKFKRVLNEFADDTQFIVVTHNKLTMEIADYLYGVTMEQKGVSKLVSVKFDGEA